MAYTDFFVIGTGVGNDMNAGSTESGTALLTSAAGNWVQATGVFTCTDAPDLSGITAGMFASIYVDGDTAPTANQYQVARITAVDNGAKTVTTSTTARSLMGTGTADGTGNRTIKIGGAWAGPTGGEGHPLDFVTAALTNADGNPPRINIKSTGTYAITAAIVISQAGPIAIQGYTSSVGDRGRPTISTSSNVVILSLTGTNLNLTDLIILSTNSTGTTTSNINTTGAEQILTRVTSTGARASGFTTNQGSTIYIECEAYDNVKGLAAGNGGFFASVTGGIYIRCVSHDNASADTDGHGFNSFNLCKDCIAYGNGGSGFRYSSGSSIALLNCDSYNNGVDGILLAFNSAAMAVIENCNFVKNGGYGINNTTSVANLYIRNCGFGGGADANTSGETSILAGSAVEVQNSISYITNPYADAANGTFNISSAQAINQGRGVFTQNSGGPTVGYLDVGAAQHLEPGPPTILKYLRGVF